MSTAKANKNKIIKLLWELYDRFEGEYSNIPPCCINEFIKGRTYHEFAMSLTKKQLKKLEQWHYVPCDKCFEAGRKRSIVKGVSNRGATIQLILQSLDCYSR